MYLLVFLLMGFAMGLTYDLIIYNLTNGRIFSCYTALLTVAFTVTAIATATLTKEKERDKCG